MHPARPPTEPFVSSGDPLDNNNANNHFIQLPRPRLFIKMVAGLLSIGYVGLNFETAIVVVHRQLADVSRGAARLSQLAAVSAIKILLIGRRGKQSKAGMDCVKTALRMNLQRAVALYFPLTWVKTGLVLSL